MKVLHIGICSVVLVSLAGCSAVGLGSKRIDYRAGATNVPSLEVPPDLTAPASDDRYRVQDGSGESVATFSDYSKGGAKAAAQSNGAMASAVLPEVKGVHLERNGAQRWLVVNDKAENVWPVVKAFWPSLGLTIKSEDQAAGIMETDWAENRAKIPQDGIRNVVGKVFDNAYSSGERDQYRTRLERSKDGLSTEIYITHRGKEEVLDADKNTSKWQTRADDPELEAEILQRLMVRFGNSPVQAATAMTSNNALPASPATDNAAASTVAPIQASGPAGSASQLEIFDGSSIIVINDPFDKSWRRVGLAIEQAGLAVEDKDRAKGIYFLRPAPSESGWMDKLQFWKDSADSNTRYRVNVKDGGAACEVSVTDQDGMSDDISKKMVEALFKHINQ